MCRGLTIPLRVRPWRGWGLGMGGGWRNYAKNVQLVNRARGAGFGGRGWSRKGSEQGVSGMVCHDAGSS